MHRPSMTVGAAALAVAALAAAASPATAAPVTTIWSGWDSVGPAPGVSATSNQVAAAGTTVVVLRTTASGAPSARQSFVVLEGDATRVGALPANQGATAVAVPAPGRVLLAGGCVVRRSTDGGARWSTATLPECSGGGTSRLTFVDADRGFVTDGSRVWTTTDGGATWRSTGTSSGGRITALGDDALLETTPLTSGETPGQGVRRSDDGGATWKVVALPGPGGGLTTSLPYVGDATRRADGVVLLGVRGAVLRSTDRGATFSRRDLPTPPALEGSRQLDVPQVVCDPAGACIARVDDFAARRNAGVRYGDQGFGAQVPAPPSPAVAPGPGTFLGADTGASGSVLRRSTDGGASYLPLITGTTTTGDLGTQGLLVVRRGDRLHLSSDHGEVWTAIPVPGTSSIERVAPTADGVVALTDDGRVQRYAGSTWAAPIDATAVEPATLAVAGSTVLVAGERGLAAIDGTGLRVLSAKALAGRRFAGITARGSRILAWAGRTIVRSTDGGRRWRTRTLPSRVEDVAFLGPRTAVALAGGSVWATRDGGARFARRGLTAAASGSYEVVAPVRLSFADARRGVASGPGIVQRTTDGGRTWSPAPTPAGGATAFGASTGGGLLVQDAGSGDLLRMPSLRTATRTSVRLVRTGRLVRRRARTGRVAVRGVLRGAPPGAEVLLGVQYSTSDRPWRLDAVDVNADGTFRARVPVEEDDQVVRAWYQGDVLVERTVASSVSRAVRIRARR